jgi:Class II Aldolase and Adducin N-terminal domain
MLSLTRRHVLVGVGVTVTAIAAGRSACAQAAAPTSAGPADPALLEDLVAANRILVDQGVLDGYGHVSVRHQGAADRYLMSRSIAPELVTAADIMEYDLDSRPVDPRGRATYLERFNARLQAQAMALGGPVTYLDPDEAKRAEASISGTIGRPWELWKRKAQGK